MRHAPLLTPAYRASILLNKGFMSKSKTFEAYVEEAELCCEQARGALRRHRFGAARGLLATAKTLYQHALNLDGITYPAVEQRLHDIAQEIQLAESAKHLAFDGSTLSKGK